MGSTKVSKRQGSIIRRKRLLLRDPGLARQKKAPPDSSEAIQGYAERSRHLESGEFPVLVVNSSQDMAKEMTMQLTLAIPGCSIMYAPTLELAAWILKRRSIKLVVSSPVLPDGGITRLTPVLKDLDRSPDLVVVGNLNLRSAEKLGEFGYEFAAMKPITKRDTEDPRQQMLTAVTTEQAPTSANRRPEPIRALGADIRNDLNNPLQEIVAMVFVAQAATVAPATKQALEAIDRAAQNMASYVNGLEDKIRDVVSVG